MAIQMGHSENGLGQHGMDIGIQRKQVRPTPNPLFHLREPAQIFTASEAREDQPQHKNIRRWIVNLNAVLPGDILGSIDGAAQRSSFVYHIQRKRLCCPLVHISIGLRFRDDVDRGRPVSFKISQPTITLTNLKRLVSIELQLISMSHDLPHASQWCNATSMVDLQNLFGERQKTCQGILS